MVSHWSLEKSQPQASLTVEMDLCVLNYRTEANYIKIPGVLYMNFGRVCLQQDRELDRTILHSSG